MTLVSGLIRDYPLGEVTAHVLGYVGTGRGAGADRRPAARAAGVPDRQERHREDLRQRPARPRQASVRFEVNALGREIKELYREDGEPGHGNQADRRSRSAALRARSACAPKPSACGGGPRRAHRRGSGAGLGADVRPRRVRQRRAPGDVARMARRPQGAAGEQGDRRPVPAGLDLQDDRRARRPRGGRGRARP